MSDEIETDVGEAVPTVAVVDDPDAAAAAAPEVGDTEDPQTQESGEGGAGRAGRDAARYRRELREEQAVKAELETQLDALRRSEVDRLVTESGDYRMHDARDLWAAGLELGDVLGEDGSIDRAKLEARTEELRADRPHLFQYRGPALYDGLDGGARLRPFPTEKSFGQLFTGKTTNNSAGGL